MALGSPEKIIIRGEILPAVICIDCSGSMARHDKIRSLINAVSEFIDTIRRSDLAKDAIEWTFITFQSDADGKPKLVDQLGDFQRATDPVDLSNCVAEGGAPLAEALHLALEKLEAKKKDLKTLGQPFLTPWLVVFTEGMSTSAPDLTKVVIDRITTLVNDDKLSVFAVGIGPDARNDFLSELSPRRSPTMINDQEINQRDWKIELYFVKCS